MEVNQEGSWEEAGGSAEICCMVRIKKRLHHIIVVFITGFAHPESVRLVDRALAHARAPAQAHARHRLRYAAGRLRVEGACLSARQSSVRIPGRFPGRISGRISSLQASSSSRWPDSVSQQ